MTIRRQIMLSEIELKTVRDLIHKSEEFDNASACIQEDHSLNHSKELNGWFSAYEDGTLSGVGSIFAPTPDEAEISLCVCPDRRNAGTGTSLLTEALRELETAGTGSRLLVCDERSTAGKKFLSGLNVNPHHAEYTMKHEGTRRRTAHPELTIREAGTDDAGEITFLCADAYGEDRELFGEFIASSLASPGRKAFVGLAGTRIVATCFLGSENGCVSINTVAVSKADQGRGYAKSLLTTILSSGIPEESEVYLDVDCTNARAIGLYRSLGFTTVRTTGYYSLGAGDMTR